MTSKPGHLAVWAAKQDDQPTRPASQAWTPADDAQLLTLLDSKMDRALIAWNLKRTVSAISKRRAILNKRRLAELGLKAKGK